VHRHHACLKTRMHSSLPSRPHTPRSLQQRPLACAARIPSIASRHQHLSRPRPHPRLPARRRLHPHLSRRQNSRPHPPPLPPPSRAWLRYSLAIEAEVHAGRPRRRQGWSDRRVCCKRRAWRRGAVQQKAHAMERSTCERRAVGTPSLHTISLSHASTFASGAGWSACMPLCVRRTGWGCMFSESDMGR